jgi:transmembrane sensor
MSTDKDIRDQATQWLHRLHEPSAEPLSPAEREEFERFIVTPRHEQEFRASNVVIAAAPELAQDARDRWTREAFALSDDRTHSRRQVLRYWAIAASLLAVLVLGGYYAQTQRWFGGEAFVTHTGETRTVTFQEGSVVYLNTRTEVRWVGNLQDRRVELTEGEALFDVVHDESRPFRVMLDNSEIRVLGTRFNVYRKSNGDTTVTVLEGTVEVRGFGNGNSKAEWVRTLNTNDRMVYTAIGLVSEPQPTHAQDAVRWRTGVYRFDDQPVTTVLDELTRYTDQHIVIRDPRIAERRVSGALSTRDARDALRRLQYLAPIEVKENNNTFTLDYRAQAERGKD